MSPPVQQRRLDDTVGSEIECESAVVQTPAVSPPTQRRRLDDEFTPHELITAEYLQENFKDTTLSNFCAQLCLKRSGRKQHKAQRIVSHLQHHPTITWMPSAPDKGVYVRSTDSAVPWIPEVTISCLQRRDNMHL